MLSTSRTILSLAIVGCFCADLTAQPPVVELIPSPPSQPEIAIPLPPTIPTVEMFAKTFCPTAGKFEVTLIHPKTCCPVTVCFCLPCKEACKVTANKHALRFSYKGKDVVIRFKHDGTVSVRDA
jgi:hypothetical protein